MAMSYDDMRQVIRETLSKDPEYDWLAIGRR